MEWWEEPWRQTAACKEAPKRIFYPSTGVSHMPALEYCNRCTVADECRDFAIRNNETLGIWGGMSAKSRNGIRPKLTDIEVARRRRLQYHAKKEDDRADTAVL